MKIWIGLFLFIILALFLKIYISNGILQIFNSYIIKDVFLIISVSSLLIGVSIMAIVFPKGIKDMSLITNLIISLMASVLVCELILAVIFGIGDLIMLIEKILNSKLDSAIAYNEIYSRRLFIKSAGLILTAIPFASFIYGITKGKYHFKVIKKTLHFPDLPVEFDGLKIVQFSDLHSGGFDSLEDVQKGFDLIQAQNPDLILFTGDLVNDIAEEILPYQHLLKNLNAPLGKYSILGNHDYSEDDGLFPTYESKNSNNLAIQKYQMDAGFVMLNNANLKIENANSYIRLIGVENWGNGFIKKGDIDKAIIGCDNNEFSILMSHDPSYWEHVIKDHSKHIQLTLSGHTHGMQMGIEMLGLKWSPIQYVYRYWAGLYQELGQYLYVNRGFGFMAFAGRVGIYPEITLFTLKHSKK